MKVDSAPAGQFFRGGYGCNHFPGGIDNLRDQRKVAAVRFIVAHCSLDFDLRGGTIAAAQAGMNRSGNVRIDKGPPGRDVQLARDDQSHVAINSSTFIPPALKPAGIDEYRNGIRLRQIELLK